MGLVGREDGRGRTPVRGQLCCLALGPPSLCGPGGPAWPPEPLWRLSGLFDLTWDQSLQAGLTDLERAMAAHGNDHLVIYGYSQGAVIANLEKRKLAEQYPAGTEAPDIDFVVGGDGNLPNGGFLARFPGLYLPIGFTFTGPAPTDTQFHTVEINRQYDGFADFPLYPLNVIADVNALLGFFYVHVYGFGFTTTRFTGLVETLLVSAATPIDDDYCELRFNFTLKKLVNEGVTSTVGAAFPREVTRQLEQDIPIWENKIDSHPPVRVAGDGPIGLFRRWAKQFYGDAPQSGGDAVDAA